eukprot:gnl/MRDRNA2_/MRDRNA2_63439_c0_seq3.p1 gnl/MRDRNA2_/MRDRNA2_63439_c0~~gnl/MRDRNA2_/MRDRNA2_63439_c0_seq3.p1  ORF type:complete len:178 (-),score=24.21 gnl/MRDRNA2_/MRDRNA2_63439_c0_seq3:25-558(-)
MPRSALLWASITIVTGFQQALRISEDEVVMHSIRDDQGLRSLRSPVGDAKSVQIQSSKADTSVVSTYSKEVGSMAAILAEAEQEKDKDKASEKVTTLSILTQMWIVAACVIASVIFCMASYFVLKWNRDLHEKKLTPKCGTVTCVCAVLCTPLACCFPIDVVRKRPPELSPSHQCRL